MSGTAQHRPGLDLMHVTIPAYALNGIEALPADVVVGLKNGRVVERGTGRTLDRGRRRIVVSKQACKDALQSLGDGNWPQRQ